MKKLDMGVVLFLMWLATHRYALRCYKHYLGLP
jgi:hypothetical protein